MNGRKSEGQPPSKRANAAGPSPATRGIIEPVDLTETQKQT
jgi:hypothetical protein